MELDAVAAELAKPWSQTLLRDSPLARMAYTALDGTPRVVPVAYLWTQQRVVIGTVPTSAKVEALRRRPAVALTIDHDGEPPRALLIRGLATVTVVDGVPQDYLDASLKTRSARSSEDFAGQVRALYDSMARIAIEPTWARLNDFETTLPRDIERLMARRG